MSITEYSGIPLSLICSGNKRQTFTVVCWSSFEMFWLLHTSNFIFKYENIQENVQEFNTLQEHSEEKQDKGGFNVWNGTALMPYKHNVSEHPGHQEEATDVSCCLVWQRKKSELCIYLANIEQSNTAEDVQIFKIQRTFKFHISSTPSVLLWGWH